MCTYGLNSVYVMKRIRPNIVWITEKTQVFFMNKKPFQEINYKTTTEKKNI